MGFWGSRVQVPPSRLSKPRVRNHLATRGFVLPAGVVRGRSTTSTRLAVDDETRRRRRTTEGGAVRRRDTKAFVEGS
jgi:hypothetical protein